MEDFEATTSRQPGFPVGQVAGAFAVLAIAALTLGVLVMHSEGRPQLGPASATLVPAAAPVTHSSPGVSVPAEVPVFIIVVGSERAFEVETMLAGESGVRRLVGDHPREVELITAASETEAEAIFAAINDQSAIPGVRPVRAVLVTAPLA